MNRHQLFPFADRPLVFGHRGYPSVTPENTRASFQKVLDEGIPGVEFDIHVCASGELVVIHDNSLERVTGSKGLVDESTFEELSALDAGAWFGEEFRGEKILRLEEVFELLGDKVYYDIEIKRFKDKGPGIAEKLLSLVRRYKLEDRVYASSFNPYVLQPYRKLEPVIPTAIIYADHKDIPVLLRRGLGRFVSCSGILKPEKSLLTRTSVLLESSILGYTVIPWTVNEEEDARRLLSMGVAGLISDNPGKILKCVENLKRVGSGTVTTEYQS